MSKPMPEPRTPFRALKADVIPFKAPEREAPAESERVRMADLEERHCKWICSSDEEGALYCGGARVPGKPYCAHHFQFTVSKEQSVRQRRF